jgi:hypothetical protein
MNAKWHLACYRSKLLRRFWQNRKADSKFNPTLIVIRLRLLQIARVKPFSEPTRKPKPTVRERAVTFLGHAKAAILQALSWQAVL